MNYLLITIDTEWDRGKYSQNSLELQNLSCIPDFHKICVIYGGRPTYFCAQEVLSNSEFITFAQTMLAQNEGEIGTHLHSWTTPPYLISRDYEVRHKPFSNELHINLFEQKLYNIKQSLSTYFGSQTSYRGGRFGFSTEQIPVLLNQGYKTDSSVTPYISWGKVSGVKPNSGPNHRNYDPSPFYFNDNKLSLLELPIGIFPRNRILKNISKKNIWSAALRKVNLGPLWLRPLPTNNYTLKQVVDIGLRQGYNVFNMFLHSNELHPDCNPYFRDVHSVNKMKNEISQLLCDISSMDDFRFVTVNEYRNIHKEFS